MEDTDSWQDDGWGANMNTNGKSVCAKEPRRGADRLETRRRGRLNGGRGDVQAGAHGGHWMTQQPLPVPPWDWYGSSARGTGPHTEGTCGYQSVHEQGESVWAEKGGRDGSRYAREGLLSFCSTG